MLWKVFLWSSLVFCDCVYLEPNKLDMSTTNSIKLSLLINEFMKKITKPNKKPEETNKRWYHGKVLGNVFKNQFNFETKWCKKGEKIGLTYLRVEAISCLVI